MAYIQREVLIVLIIFYIYFCGRNHSEETFDLCRKGDASAAGGCAKSVVCQQVHIRLKLSIATNKCENFLHQCFLVLLLYFLHVSSRVSSLRFFSLLSSRRCKSCLRLLWRLPTFRRPCLLYSCPFCRRHWSEHETVLMLSRWRHIGIVPSDIQCTCPNQQNWRCLGRLFWLDNWARLNYGIDNPVGEINA